MATLDQIGAALKQADAAGNVEDARRLAAAYKAAQGQQTPPDNLGDQSTLAPKADTSPLGWLSQGMSGLNEGIAKGLGAPIDLATAGINLATTGANALLHTDIPQIEHPVGGSETFTGLLSPTIKPESSDKGQQFLRRVGQEVGMFAVPGGGTVAKAERPLATAATELATSIAAGTGAATARQVAPGNPWVELGAELAGGFTPATLVNTLKRATMSKAAPTIAELTAAKDAAYKAADAAGVKYSAPAFKRLAGQMVKGALDDNISAARHPVATSMLQDIAAKADAGHAPTLTELDQLRQVVRRDVVNPSYGNPNMAADAHFGNQFLDDIDHFINTAGHGDVVSGDAAKAASIIKTARELNTRLRKTELIQDVIAKATRRTESTGSGGNINNALRQGFRQILDNPKRVRAFNAQERTAIAQLVKQNRMDDLLRYIGKASPGGNGLVGLLEVGATVAHPGMGAVPLAGFAAKTIADARTVGKAKTIAADVARGGPVASVPKSGTPAQIAAAKAQLAAALTNQLGPRQPIQITVAGGAPAR